MDIVAIERVIGLVEQSQLHKVTVTDGDKSISVVNRLSNVSASQSAAISSNTEQTAASDSNTGSNATKATVQVVADNVGYVHLSPDAAMDNLVNIGDSIEIGQTVAYINVLNKMLPVVSKKAGVVESVLVESGQSVEYGQPILQLL